jgi:arsenical-resistance protein 2
MDSEVPWYNAYPEPRNGNPFVVTRQQLLDWLSSGQKPGVDFLLIDLRRADHKVRPSYSLSANSYPAGPRVERFEAL